MPGRRRSIDRESLVRTLIELGELGDAMTDADVDLLMEIMPQLFRAMCREAGYEEAQIRAVITKFRDAGRRSPPTAAASSRGPGLPKDARDGNRANGRWELPSDHRYFAPKRDAQLVEIRYFLQALSMRGAPHLSQARSRTAFMWLLGHELRPGEYKDPIMLRDIDFDRFLADRRRVQSGHYEPLARGGRHEPSNTFLMLARSNSLQSDLTFDEFMALVGDILRRQADAGFIPDFDKVPSDQFLEEAKGTIAE